jgi:hypothetical protein
MRQEQIQIPLFLLLGKSKSSVSSFAEITDDCTSCGTFPNLRNSIATLLNRETYRIRIKRKKLKRLGRFHM